MYYLPHHTTISSPGRTLPQLPGLDGRWGDVHLAHAGGADLLHIVADVPSMAALTSNNQAVGVVRQARTRTHKEEENTD